MVAAQQLPSGNIEVTTHYLEARKASAWEGEYIELLSTDT